MTPRIVAIVQARMRSSRLPAKVLADLRGMPMIARVVRRVRAIPRVSEVVVATGAHEANRPLVDAGRTLGVAVFAGSEDDVLDRYYQAAREHRADVVVRITADCPLLDPEVSGRVVHRYLAGDVDMAANVYPPTFPDGFDTWVVSMAALERAWREARLRSEREHVMPYIAKHTESFRVANVASPTDLSAHRWTVDEPEDLAFVCRVYEALDRGEGMFSTREVLDLLAREPGLRGLNAGIGRDEGYAKSLREDAIVSVLPADQPKA